MNLRKSFNGQSSIWLTIFVVTLISCIAPSQSNTSLIKQGETVASLSSNHRIISEEGSIDRVFFKQFSSQELCLNTQEEINGIGDFFIKNRNRYDPCVQTSIFYSGNMVNWGDGVRICSEKYNLVDSLLIADSIAKITNGELSNEVISKWIADNQPFSDRYPIIKFGEQKTVDLRNLSEQVRIQLLMQLVPALSLNPQVNSRNGTKFISWNSGSSFLGEQVVVEPPSNLSEFVDTLFNTVEPEMGRKLLQLNSSVMENYSIQLEQQLREKAYPDDSVQMDYQVINIRRICNDIGTSTGDLSVCLTKINSAISSELQDSFHVRKVNADSVNLNMSSVDPIVLEHKEIVLNYLEKLCYKAGSERDALSATQGGNLFVLDDVVFVGADEIEKYANNRTYADLLGLTTNHSVRSLEKKIALYALGTEEDSDKKVIWVGTPENKRTRYERTEYKIKKAQPVYHIDLFFNPIGEVNNANGETTFYYLFGKIDSAEAANNSRLDSLAAWLDDTRKALNEQLKKKGYKNIETIFVPLKVKYESEDGEISDYSIFINGVFDRNLDSSLRYLFPKKTRGFWLNDQDEVLEKLRKTLVGQDDLEVIELESADYEPYAGLRCRIKVIKRHSNL